MPTLIPYIVLVTLFGLAFLIFNKKKEFSTLSLVFIYACMTLETLYILNSIIPIPYHATWAYLLYNQVYLLVLASLLYTFIATKLLKDLALFLIAFALGLSFLHLDSQNWVDLNFTFNLTIFALCTINFLETIFIYSTEKKAQQLPFLITIAIFIYVAINSYILSVDTFHSLQLSADCMYLCSFLVVNLSFMTYLLTAKLIQLK